MKTKILLPSFMLIMFIALTSWTSTSPVTKYNVKLEIPVIFTFPTNSCTGEPIDIDVVVYLHIWGSITPNGKVHGNFHGRQLGTGKGQISGADYILNGMYHESYNSSVGEVFNITGHENLISKGNLPNMHFHYQVHITVNANGTATANIYVDSIKCQ